MAVPGLIVKKIGMTRMVDPDGQMIPVTLLQVEPHKVTKILSPERDGYKAVQVGFQAKAEKNLTKPDITRLRKASISENFSKFKEIRCENTEGIQIGSIFGVDAFAEVKSVDVTGITKGHGFQGSIKRWGTSRGRMTHGSMYHRRPGSLGNRSTPGRVFKNKPIPGHMGNVQRTIQNLKVMNIDVASNIIALKGAVPGHRDGVLLIRPSIKA